MQDIFDIPTAPAQLGEFAIVDDKAGVNITTQRRLELAINPATANHALALTQQQAKKVTQNRIRSAMAEMAHGKIDQVNTWLDEVGAKDPARAIELFMELTQFSLPKLKSMEVGITNPSRELKDLSIGQLEAMLDGDESVVAEQ